jgi:hypothetical protein
MSVGPEIGLCVLDLLLVLWLCCLLLCYAHCDYSGRHRACCGMFQYMASELGLVHWTHDDHAAANCFYQAVPVDVASLRAVVHTVLAASAPGQ